MLNTVRSKDKTKRYWAIVLVLVCLPAFSFFSDFSVCFADSAAYDAYDAHGAHGAHAAYDAYSAHAPDITQEAGSGQQRDAIQGTGLPHAVKTPLTGIFVQDTDFYQIIRYLSNGLQFSNCKNNTVMTIFLRLLCGLIFAAALSFVSLAGQSTTGGFRRYIIIPHSIHAPPAPASLGGITSGGVQSPYVTGCFTT